MNDIKAQQSCRSDLIHVLPAGSGGAHECELEFAVVYDNTGCYLNEAHSIQTASGHSRAQDTKAGPLLATPCPGGLL